MTPRAKCSKPAAKLCNVRCYMCVGDTDVIQRSVGCCFTTMYIITGAPMIGVIAFSGIMLPVAGVVLSRLHRRATKPPVIMVQGIRDD